MGGRLTGSGPLRRYLLICGALVNLVAIVAVLLLLFNAGRALGFYREIYQPLTVRYPSFAWILPDLGGQAGTNKPRIAFQPPSTAETFQPVPVLISELPPKASGRVLRVGANQSLTTPSQAAAIAQDGDTVLIEPGEYSGDTAVWEQDNLHILGDEGMVQLNARGVRLPQEKAIWIVRGDNVRIENIEFFGAQSRDRNGAGIRSEGTDLHVVNCYFHDNESGILAGKNIASKILIEHSEFARNGHSDGQAHNLYIGEVASLVFRFNYVHHGHVGSNLKSRAHKNTIQYNMFFDYERGRSNYAIDLSNGGVALVTGNVVQQGPATENFHLLAFAPEGPKNPTQSLVVTHNTFVNDRNSGRFIMNRSAERAKVFNNLFIGNGDLIKGPGVFYGNSIMGNDNISADNFEQGQEGGLNSIQAGVEVAARQAYNYTLIVNSSAVDAGVKLEQLDGEQIEAKYQPLGPRRYQLRIPMDSTPDAGAYELQ